MKLVLTFCIAFIIAISSFALYFCCVVGVFPFTKTIAEFSGMFQPLEALFTALAFLALVITAWAQAKDLRQTKRETAQALVVASRLQAAGARLISMAVEKDPSAADARRELEKQVEELEERLQKYLRDCGC